MLKRIRIAVILALAATFLAAIPGLAAPPTDLHIEVDEHLGVPDPFVASGTAVDDGLVCGSGIVTDEEVIVVNPSATRFRTLRVLKKFDCGDGSGTFDLRLIVRLNLNTNETTARWRVVDGTGAYTSLRGRGSLVGTPFIGGITDVYDGAVH